VKLMVQRLMFAGSGRALLAFSLASALLTLAAPPTVRAQAQVIQDGPASYVSSSEKLKPTPGTPGADAAKANYMWYILPGMGEANNPDNAMEERLPHQPFALAYANQNQAVASNKWWSQIGFQWFVPETGAGFAFDWDQGLTRTGAFVNEPYYMQFLDFEKNGKGNPLGTDVTGLRLVSTNSLYVSDKGKRIEYNEKEKKQQISKFDPEWNAVERGNINPETQPVVTVGLRDIHPLGEKKPDKPPWTNLRIDSYSDWGVVLSYTDNGSAMQITMASGSPFVWFNRTSGSAQFAIWAGSNHPDGKLVVWSNSGPKLGLTVTNFYSPVISGPDLLENGAIKQVENTAAYAIYADKGTWQEEKITTPQGKISRFVNPDATKVVVLALPHSVPTDQTTLLQNAMDDLGQYACSEITGTQIDYPPITSSATSATIGGNPVSLGYDQANAVLRYQLRVTTSDFGLPGCTSGKALLMLMPHHVKELYPGQSSALNTQYQWHGLVGPLTAFVGNSFVDQLRTYGVLSMFPAVLPNSSLKNPLYISGQLAVEDVYSTLTNWYYLEETKDPKNPKAHLDSFVRNLGTYDNIGANTYEQKWETLIDTAQMADQLSTSTKLKGEMDNSNNPVTGACLCMNKAVVAQHIRNYVLESLKGLVSQWFDIYSAHLFQYMPNYNTIIGFPAGYGSAQDINDHHFHYGYFLRAAALIGRYDSAWLKAYGPAIDLLRQDVANYDRTKTKFPFLRNFDVYAGHSWATGVGGGSLDQESVSEAVNFAAGLIELAQEENNPGMLAVGELLYEQEIADAQDYWFNVDGNLTPAGVTNASVSSTPLTFGPHAIAYKRHRLTALPTDYNNVEYNGNWPKQFVNWMAENKNWNITIAQTLYQKELKRNGFFGPAVPSSYFIQFLPMSATGLWQGRNQAWLSATWKQYLMDAKAEDFLDKTPWETFFADIQARLPDSTTDPLINGTGLVAALKRIAKPHEFTDFGDDTMAKYWAYNNSILGQVDTSVVADQPNYAVFVKNGKQTFVGYNPGATDATFTFSKASDGTQVAQFDVPAGTIMSQGAAGNTSFTPSTGSPPAGRLYLQTATGPVEGPLTGQLTGAPGTWLPPAGPFDFPSSDNISRLMPSLTIIPVAKGNCSDVEPPGKPCGSNQAYGEWTGTFSGNLAGQLPHTRFAIYADPALHAGWQRAPGVKNVTHLLVKYWFDASKAGTTPPDRIEVYWRGTNADENTFVIGANKVTDYYFGCYTTFPEITKCDPNVPNGLYGLAGDGPDSPAFSKAVIDNRPNNPVKPFPSSVTCGEVQVFVYGAAGADQTAKSPLPVSTSADPLLDRSSWVQPPYDGGSCAP
jgi:Glycosyl hydrolase family 81 C-terminal domain